MIYVLRPIRYEARLPYDWLYKSELGGFLEEITPRKELKKRKTRQKWHETRIIYMVFDMFLIIHYTKNEKYKKRCFTCYILIIVQHETCKI